MLNSVVYEVEFPDGDINEYTANTISENMITQVNSDGFSTTMMDGIVDYRKDPEIAVPKSNRYVVTKHRQKRMHKSTVGWQLLVKLKDQSESWIHLKDLKESNPVEVAEFAEARGIADKPAFVWWVPYTTGNRDVILSAIKLRIRKTTHKYGIKTPRSILHTNEVDRAQGGTFWRDALAKEMLNIGIAFEILPDGQKTPVGWHKVTVHLVWYVNMKFTRKARWVLDGHKTPSILAPHTQESCHARA